MSSLSPVGRRLPVVHGSWLVVPAALAVAALMGALIAVQPAIALSLVGALAVAALAFLAPVTHLSLLLFVTAIVPYDVQNQFSGGGGGSAGLLFSDLLLLTGLARAVLVLLARRLTPRHAVALVMIAAVASIAALQTLRGIQFGAPISLAGFEFRAVLGWSTLIIAVPVLLEEAGRRRLLRGLLLVGLGLGLWGLAQYFLNIPLIGGGSAGIRENVAFTEGASSIQGGLFGFPIAFVLGLAVLSSSVRFSAVTRTALVAVVLSNGASLLLTYQRTFWVAAVVGFGFVVVRARRGQKVRAVVPLLAALLLVLPGLALLSPGSVIAAQQRLLSIGQFDSDDSVRTRVVETRAVAERIREAPATGAGLGDEVSFGYPWLRVPPAATPYTHNGYLWLAWKLGIPAALLLLLLVAWAVVAPAPRGLDDLMGRVRHGAQAGLLIALTVSLTFPAFRALAITTTLGVLVALSLISPLRDASSDLLGVRGDPVPPAGGQRAA